MGAGQFCGKPSKLGKVYCPDHSTALETRRANEVLEEARRRVLLRLEESADDLATELVSIAKDREMAPDARLIALNTAFKVLGLDKVQVQVETSDVTPGKASRDARLLDLLERAGSPDRAALVRGALGIVETTASG